VSGYSYNRQGSVTLLRGNVDSIYPNAPEAQERRVRGEFTDAPFLTPTRAFVVPIAADFIGTGDFDADGHQDVVAAMRNGNRLYFLLGDGNGRFADAKEVVLKGSITAFVTGEINRADGLTDIVVAIGYGGRAQALVFEGPEGAMRAMPETFDLPAEATALVLGQLDGRPENDLAVAAGTDLI